MLVVIDTNILVSTLWSRNGAPARTVGLVLSGRLTPCYDHRIMLEYRKVLQRPKFRFRPSEVNVLLDWFKQAGRSVVPAPVDLPFVDEADRKFYEVAKYCGAVLITGIGTEPLGRKRSTVSATLRDKWTKEPADRYVVCRLLLFA